RRPHAASQPGLDRRQRRPRRRGGGRPERKELTMRTLAIGDVHGCLVALQALLRLVAPAEGDVLVALGDYVDRGPDSKGVLDCLVELYDAELLVPLCGNHDEMMVEANLGHDRGLWLSCGGRETLASYGHEVFERTYDRVPARHWRFLEDECRDYYE